MAISTNLVFSDWNRIFKDPMTTMAAIVRVAHHSVILDLMDMDSYRAGEAAHQHTPPRPPVERSHQLSSKTRSRRHDRQPIARA